MSEQKHTPERLYVGVMNDCIFLIDRPPRPAPADDYPHGGDPETSVVAKLDYPGAGAVAEEMAARWNAHADLLAACEFALAGILQMGSDWSDEAGRRLQAAVAKAEGRA